VGEKLMPNRISHSITIAVICCVVFSLIGLSSWPIALAQSDSTSISPISQDEFVNQVDKDFIQGYSDKVLEESRVIQEIGERYGFKSAGKWIAAIPSDDWASSAGAAWEFDGNVATQFFGKGLMKAAIAYEAEGAATFAAEELGVTALGLAYPVVPVSIGIAAAILVGIYIDNEISEYQKKQKKEMDFWIKSMKMDESNKTYMAKKKVACQNCCNL
jgi:hypothetical protein